MVSMVDEVPVGFKKTELGLLPFDWNIVILSHVFKEKDIRVKNHSDPSAYHAPVLSLTKNYGLILQSERFDKRVALEDVSDYKVIETKEIVYNPYVIWEGAIHILDKFPIGLVSPAYPVLEVKNVADPVFVDYLLRTPLLISAYNQFSAGAVNRRRSINKRDFLSIKIPFPPLPEQRAIAHVLSTIQRTIEAQDKVITAAREMKKSLMRHLFTYGSISVDTTSQITLIETSRGYLNKDWKLINLSDLSDIRYGLGQPPKTKESGVPVIRATNIKCGRIHSDDLLYADTDALPASRNPYLKIGDVIVVRSGAYTGDVARIDETWAGSVAGYDLVISPKSKLSSAYLAQYLLSYEAQSYFRSQRDRSAQPHLNAQQLSDTQIPFPNIEEQQVVANILCTMDTKIEVEENRKSALQTLFKTMLHLLMTGQLRVKDLQIEN